MGHNWTLRNKSHSVITHLLFRCLILVITHKRNNNLPPQFIEGFGDGDTIVEDSSYVTRMAIVHRMKFCVYSVHCLSWLLYVN